MRARVIQWPRVRRPGAAKYANTKTVIDGITFDSKGEGELYAHLGLLKRIGDVAYFLRQVPFHLPGGVVYRCDFMVVSRQPGGPSHTWRTRYLDFKGYETREFKTKKKLVEALYPVQIELVTKVRGRLSGV